MYSPKIAEDLISLLYQLKQTRQKPMTQLVDELLRPQLLKPYKQSVKSKANEECKLIRKGGGQKRLEINANFG